MKIVIELNFNEENLYDGTNKLKKEVIDDIKSLYKGNRISFTRIDWDEIELLNGTKCVVRRNAGKLNMGEHHFYIKNAKSFMEKNSVIIELKLTEQEPNHRYGCEVHFDKLCRGTFEEDKIINYLKKQKNVITNILENTNSKWIPYEERQEFYSLLASMYINISSINAIVFTNELSICHIQRINWNEKMKHFSGDNNSQIYAGRIYYNEERISNNSFSNTFWEKTGNCLGCYIDINTRMVFQHLKRTYGDEIIYDYGNYIFMCEENIWNFMQEMIIKGDLGDLNSLDFLARENGIDIDDFFVEITLLHEMGHMAFNNNSVTYKNIDEETLANWFASIGLSYFEIDIIKAKTQKQSEEYRNYIYLPEMRIKLNQNVKETFEKYCSDMRRIIDQKRR